MSEVLATAGLTGAGGGALAANVQAFARLLRRSGLPIGVSEMLHGLEALEQVALGDRRQVHAALRAVMVHRREHFELFDQAFLLFWRIQTNASPDDSLFYAVYLFQQAFRSFDFGFAAAMAWLIFVIIMIITLIQVKFGNRLVYYEGDRR